MMDESKRRQGLGGSEVPAIFHADPRRTPFDLWLLKTGQLQPTAPSLRMRLGKMIERPYQIYSPDGIVPDQRRGVEIKVVFQDFAHEWGEPPNEVPLRVELQVWHYMSALDYPLWDVYACISGDMKLYTIERDPEAEAVMLEREREWVERYIVRGEHPPLEHSEDAKRWLLKSFPTHKRPDLRPAEGKEIDLLEEYVSLRIREKLLEGRKDELETNLKAAIKDREGLEWDDGRFTWRTRKGKTSTNWEAVARGLMGLVPEDVQETLLKLHTHTGAGTRAIGLVSERYREAVKEGAAVAT